MGGLIILLGVTVSALLWADLGSVYVWSVLAIAAAFGVIGFYDDYLKVTSASHQGLSGKARLAMEAVVAALGVFVMTRYGENPLAPTVAFPFFKDVAVNLGIFFLAFAAFVIVGAGNAVNLTDGLDGLAIVPVMIAAASFGPDRLCHRPRHLRRLSSDQFCARRLGIVGHLWRADRSRPRLFVVQRTPCGNLHGRYRVPVAGRAPGCHCGGHKA